MENDRLNELQMKIMIVIKHYANTEKLPIPQKYIIQTMKTVGVKSYTALNATNSLIKKGYIRRAYSPQANKTFYVMIRNIND